MFVTLLSARKQDVNIVIIFFLNEVMLRSKFNKMYWIRSWEWMKDELAGFLFSLLVGLWLDRWRRIHVLLLGLPFLEDQAPLMSWISTESLKRLSSLNSWLCRDRKPLKTFSQLQILSFPPPQFQKSLRSPSLLTLTASLQVLKIILEFNNSLEGPTELRKAVLLMVRVYYSERMQIKSAEVRVT